MKPLDPAQQAELERRIAEDRVTGRGRRLALGLMFGAETGVVGAVITALAGGLWFLGALLGVAVTGLLWLALLAVPLGVRARVGTFLARPRGQSPLLRAREPESWAAWQRDGVSNHREPKQPYWPQ